MKKWYKLIIVLGIVSSLLSGTKNVFGAQNGNEGENEELPDYEKWVNWSNHSFTDNNPWLLYGYYDNNNMPIDWYKWTIEDANKGIIVKYTPTNNQYSRYYYFSLNNTATINEINLLGEARYNRPVELWDGNTTIIDGDFGRLFPLANKLYVRMAQDNLTLFTENYDISCTSSQDLYNKLQEYGFENPNASDPNLGNMPYFYLKVNGPAGNHNTFMGDVEYTLTWDCRDSFIQDQRDYYIQVFVWNGNENSFNGNWSNRKAIKNTDMSPFNMGMLAFSWTYTDMERLWLINNWTQHHFRISIRITDGDGNPVNNKWVNFSVSKMYEITSGFNCDDVEGSPTGTSIPFGERREGIFQFTDGRPVGDNTNEDGTQNSNGSSVSPEASEAGINNYDPTNAYGNYSFGSSLQSLQASLTEMVQTIGNLPEIFAKVASFMPTWLISLIGVSIGMLVLIGVVKTLTK